jgi:multicomponent K+:H+ antiporter subunit G
MLVSSAVAGRPVIHELLITLFVAMTTPVSAATLMAAAIARTKSKERT